MRTLKFLIFVLVIFELTALRRRKNRRKGRRRYGPGANRRRPSIDPRVLKIMELDQEIEGSGSDLDPNPQTLGDPLINQPLKPLIKYQSWKISKKTNLNLTTTIYSFEDAWRLPREFDVCRYANTYSWRDKCYKNKCTSNHRKQIYIVNTWKPNLCTDQIQFRNGGGRHCRVERSEYEECPGFFGVYKRDNSGMTMRTEGMVCPMKYWKCYYYNDWL